VYNVAGYSDSGQISPVLMELNDVFVKKNTTISIKKFSLYYFVYNPAIAMFYIGK
jgi:hypothetical protein